MAMDPKDLLRTVIDASGLSARKWAEDVAWRDERTIRRWLAGDSPIPEIVVEKLKAIAAKPGSAPAAPEKSGPSDAVRAARGRY